MEQRGPHREPSAARPVSHKAADEMQALANVFASASTGGAQKQPPWFEAYRSILTWAGIGLLAVVLFSVGALLYLRPGEARQMYADGERLAAAGKAVEAIAFFDQAVRKDPGNADAYYARALSYGTLGNDSKVVQDLNVVLRLRPSFADAYFRRGSIYLKRGEYQKALQDLSRVLELNPGDGRAYNLRGSAYRSLGDYPRAIQDYSKAVDADPTVDNYFQRATAYRAAGENQKALADLDAVIALRPDVYFMYAERANVRKALGDSAGSEADRRKARELEGPLP